MVWYQRLWNYISGGPEPTAQERRARAEAARASIRRQVGERAQLDLAASREQKDNLLPTPRIVVEDNGESEDFYDVSYTFPGSQTRLAQGINRGQYFSNADPRRLSHSLPLRPTADYHIGDNRACREYTYLNSNRHDHLQICSPLTDPATTTTGFQHQPTQRYMLGNNACTDFNNGTRVCTFDEIVDRPWSQAHAPDALVGDQAALHQYRLFDGEGHDLHRTVIAGDNGAYYDISDLGPEMQRSIITQRGEAVSDSEGIDHDRHFIENSEARGTMGQRFRPLVGRLLASEVQISASGRDLILVRRPSGTQAPSFRTVASRIRPSRTPLVQPTAVAEPRLPQVSQEVLAQREAARQRSEAANVAAQARLERAAQDSPHVVESIERLAREARHDEFAREELWRLRGLPNNGPRVRRALLRAQNAFGAQPPAITTAEREAHERPMRERAEQQARESDLAWSQSRALRPLATNAVTAPRTSDHPTLGVVPSNPAPAQPQQNSPRADRERRLAATSAAIRARQARVAQRHEITPVAHPAMAPHTAATPQVAVQPATHPVTAQPPANVERPTPLPTIRGTGNLANHILIAPYDNGHIYDLTRVNSRLRRNILAGRRAITGNEPGLQTYATGDLQRNLIRGHLNISLVTPSRPTPPRRAIVIAARDTRRPAPTATQVVAQPHPPARPTATQVVAQPHPPARTATARVEAQPHPTARPATARVEAQPQPTARPATARVEAQPHPTARPATARVEAQPHPTARPATARVEAQPHPTARPATARVEAQPQPTARPATARVEAQPQPTARPATARVAAQPQPTARPATARVAAQPQPTARPATARVAAQPQPTARPATARVAAQPQPTARPATARVAAQPQPTARPATARVAAQPQPTARPATARVAAQPQPTARPATARVAAQPQPTARPATARVAAQPQPTARPATARVAAQPQPTARPATARVAAQPQPTARPATARVAAQPQVTTPRRPEANIAQNTSLTEGITPFTLVDRQGRAMNRTVVREVRGNDVSYFDISDLTLGQQRDILANQVSPSIVYREEERLRTLDPQRTNPLGMFNPRDIRIDNANSRLTLTQQPTEGHRAPSFGQRSTAVTQPIAERCTEVPVETVTNTPVHALNQFNNPSTRTFVPTGTPSGQFMTDEEIRRNGIRTPINYYYKHNNCTTGGKGASDTNAFDVMTTVAS